MFRNSFTQYSHILTWPLLKLFRVLSYHLHLPARSQQLMSHIQQSGCHCLRRSPGHNIQWNQAQPPAPLPPPGQLSSPGFPGSEPQCLKNKATTRGKNTKIPLNRGTIIHICLRNYTHTLQLQVTML